MRPLRSSMLAMGPAFSVARARSLRVTATVQRGRPSGIRHNELVSIDSVSAIAGTRRRLESVTGACIFGNSMHDHKNRMKMTERTNTA